jgi:formiminotetrahydrofolate cyclodeaminase
MQGWGIEREGGGSRAAYATLRLHRATDDYVSGSCSIPMMVWQVSRGKKKEEEKKRRRKKKKKKITSARQ